MNKNIVYIAVSLLLLMFAACDKNEPILFGQDSGDGEGSGDFGYVSFVKKSLVATEGTEPRTYAIPVMVTATATGSVTVDYEFVSEGDNAAVLDTDFKVLNPGGLTFPNGWGYDTIFIETIPNGVFTGDKQFQAVLTGNSANYPLGADSIMTVTVADSEHPLNLVLGDYTIPGTDVWGDNLGMTINIKPFPDNLTQVILQTAEMFPGWGFTEEDQFLADIDLENMTFSIQAGQGVPTRGYGPSKITAYTAESEGETQFEDGTYIVGTIAEDGTITMPHYLALQITSGSNAGLHFSIWNPTVWTKGKKSATVSKNADLNKTPRSFNK